MIVYVNIINAANTPIKYTMKITDLDVPPNHTKQHEDFDFIYQDYPDAGIGDFEYVDTEEFNRQHGKPYSLDQDWFDMYVEISDMVKLANFIEKL